MSRTVQHAEEREPRSVLSPGTLALVSLDHPREKFWGSVQEIGTAGIFMRGVELNSFDDFLLRLRDGEEAAANEVFFPMHRVERVEADVRNGVIPSLGERFQRATGRAPAVFFRANPNRSVRKR